MIVFKKLRWKNFLSTGDTFTELSLTGAESSLIVGENGAGKSTFLDALCFSLYGKPFRNVNKNQLLNSINGKGLMVELDFAVGNKEYHIKRGIKPNVFEIYINGNLQDQLADVREYQSWFERSIVQMDHKSFSQVVVLGSANYIPFMQLPTTQRRQVIEDLLGINIFSVMNNLLKEKVSANKEYIKENDHAIDKVEIELNLMEDYSKQENVKKQEQIASLNDKASQIEQEIADTQSAIDLKQSEIKKLEEAISDRDQVKTKVEKLKTLYNQVKDKVRRLEKEVEFFEQNDDCPTCKQSIDPDFKDRHVCDRKEKTEESRVGLTQMEQQVNELTSRLNEIADIVNNISSINQEISAANGSISSLQRHLKDIRQSIDDLNNESESNQDYKAQQRKLKQSLKELAGQKEQLINDREVLRVASVLLKDGGIKSKIIKQYIPIMNKLINKYLAQMDFFVNFELDEEFNETIKSRFRDAFSYDSFSEGEKMRIDLALLFTWRAIAKLRNSASTNLLIMDEVFDSSLDNTGTDELLRIINELTKDTNTFIISHKGDQLFDKFTNVIRFEKHKNFSRIKAA